MSQPIIVVEGLSKRYMVGAARRQDLLRDRLSSGFGSAWRRVTGRRTAADRAKPDEEFWALRDVSFEIQPGEVVGIIGRNGAGKSTLLKILSRITEPTSGRVSLRGRVASLLEVGTGFHPELTGRENIFLNGSILGMSRDEIRRKFDEIVAFAEIGPFLDTPVKRYSSGMYVRLAFAVSAHLEPEILIVDEVLAVGDIAFQKKCLGKMHAVSAEEGRTVLFVSHNIDAVRRLCNSVILLAAGRVQAIGPTPRVLNLYLQDHFDAEPPRVPVPDAHLREQAYVTAVTLEALNGRPRSVVAVGEPWRVRIGVQASRAYPKFVVGLGLVSADGIAAQTAWSEPAEIKPGAYELIFEQLTFLQAGTYTLVVGLSDSDQTFQQIEAARFDISGDAPHGYFPMTSGVGIVLNSMRVALHRV
jgi:lipopolysaccharide transport system ATP-binding protein